MVFELTLSFSVFFSGKYQEKQTGFLYCMYPLVSSKRGVISDTVCQIETEMFLLFLF